MTRERSPKVGLLALMLELYDQSNPELRPDREGFAQRIVALLSECADVTYGGIANTRAGVEAACRGFTAQDVDAVVVACLTYAPSLIALPSLRDLAVPIILLNTQELAGVGESFDHGDLLRNHGVHGLHDLANVLSRSNVPFEIVTGHIADPAVRRELTDWCCAAYAVRGLRSLRVGLFGHPFTGMGDFGVDETTFLAEVGPEVDRVDPAELPRRMAGAPAGEVRALMEADRAAYAVSDGVTPEIHEASSRAEWALRDIVRERGLGAIALHYPPLAAASPGGVLPFLGAAKLMEEGVGFGGEGDVTSAALVHLAGLLFGEASFTEMFTIDFEGGAVFHSHFAEANPALAREDQPIRLVRRDGWVGCGGPSASLAFSNQPGPATLMNLTVGAQGSFRLIAAEVEVLDYTRPTFDSPHFKARPSLPLKTFLTGYLEANPLYASLNLKLRSPSDLRTVTDALQPEREPIVRNVLNIDALVDRVVTVTTFVRTAGVVMVAVVGLIVLFIIVNTIRLAVVARAEEIEIMRLVGASDAFIRWPFVFEGALVGLLGALIALGLLAAAAEPLSEAMVGFFSVLPLQLGYLARDTAAIVLATGLGLGILGSWLSVRTYLIR